MPPLRTRGPSTFGEWMLGTTVSSVAASRARKEKTTRREVLRIEVATDDETEEDTIKVTYPRTGRTKRSKRAETIQRTDDVEETEEPKQGKLPEHAERARPPHKTVESVVKKVRFEDGPIKSAMKKTTVTTVEAEGTSDSNNDTTSESGESSTKETDSEAETSSDASKAPKAKKKQKKPVETDSSDGDSEPHPKCNCIEAWEKLKKAEAKKGKHVATDTETSDSEPEPAPKAKNQNANKGKQKKGGKAPEPETSESEPDTPVKAKKKGGKKVEVSDTDGETSESAKESDAEEPEPPKKKADKGKPNNNQKGSQKNKGKSTKNNKAQNQNKKSNKQDNEEEAEESSKGEPATSGGGKKIQNKNKKGDDHTGETRQKSRYHDVEKYTYPEAFQGPEYRRPNLIEPVRAQMLQTERVIEGPEDPPANAYYDPQHNVVRVYYGPVYGQHHGQALYPPRGPMQHPLPVGMPHPTNNPYYYGFSDPQQQQQTHQQKQQQQQQPPPPPPPPPPPQPGQGDYSTFPITEGAPAPGLTTSAGPPPGAPQGMGPHGMLPYPYPTQGPWNPAMYWVPGHYEAPNPVATRTPWDYDGKNEKEIIDPSRHGSPSSQNKGKDADNNVGPEGLKGDNNPYLVKSQFSNWGSNDGKRKVSNNSPKDGSKVNTNTDWNNAVVDNANDEAQDWENNWNTEPANDTWQTNNGQESQRKTSHGTNHTVQKGGDHWATASNWGKDDEYKGDTSWDNTNNDNQAWCSGGNGGNGSEASKKSGSGGNNIMPGSWVDTPTVPTWGDPTAAADTGGKLDVAW